MQKLANYKRLWLVLIVAVVAFGLEFGAHQNGIAQVLVTVLGSLIALLMFIDMVKTLRSGKFGVDLLAITAVIATLAIGEYRAALIVLLMLTGGDALEDYAASKANSDLKQLLENSPQTAHLLGETTREIPVDDVQIGDHLLVKPGEVVPVDGTLLKGTATLDESSLTGESRPIDKRAGESVMSGAVNGDAAFEFVADRQAKDSQYQSIIQLVKQAEAQPAHFVRMADRYAVPFTILAYVIAGTGWIVSGDPVRFAQVLVVASPCPLILAAPIALVAGMSRASQSGIIVKTGTTLEKLAKVKTVAFDKTGTITKGNLTVTAVLPEPETTAAELLTLAATTEQQSNHILARAIVAAAPDTLPSATALTEVTGGGVQATVNGRLVKAGKADFVMPANSITKSAVTAVYVSADDHYLGRIEFADELRPEARQTMSGLHQLGIRNLVMISGDRQPIAEKIAKAVGIDEVHADCLPEDKIKVLATLSPVQRPVAMVGDGVNDAPSLVTADVGLAMGASGATAASESADAVIMKDDLSRVVTATTIARYTMKIARQSVLIGIAICTILMLIASFGVIPTIVGALLQEVVDTVTILYALRARSQRAVD
ncbi:heavy metal translocating P-type ATPase [Secundilactobacillus paracollinoides]|uniref:Cd(2+)-exporting ATPase n=1 Tax=Secundilactobacillus paracollinoides TaxID=240427 RepID=A0A1B2IV58_9LACO|nr:heavy metal translocating P-type ATPase [Secundilactobacillus paracollinoides]ANZ60141.1 cobalt ABC transporter ATP-binding protein [Secundilactobacillus paracollinoides]ANZ65935.1 cobalt ABC transporter ATP-binding protein [Secundilactobacillus paracollinoides]